MAGNLAERIAKRNTVHNLLERHVFDVEGVSERLVVQRGRLTPQVTWLFEQILLATGLHWDQDEEE